MVTSINPFIAVKFKGLTLTKITKLGTPATFIAESKKV
nr:MAG TPA: hypothetical protein [Caudoviricetes sp.]